MYSEIVWADALVPADQYLTASRQGYGGGAGNGWRITENQFYPRQNMRFILLTMHEEVHDGD